MGEPCKDCTKWTEDIYWTHFQPKHFSHILLNGFDQQLAIPKKFSNNLKQKLPESVALRGPSGVTWTVGITNKEDTLFFKHGWQEFVKDHALGPNDMLVFRYNGESQFDVLMFDGQSLCEKEASYFIRKCGHTELESGCLANKGKTRKTSCEEAQASSKNGGCSVLEKSEDNGSTGLPSEEQVIVTSTAHKNELRKEDNSNPPTRSRRLAAKRGRPPTYSVGVVNYKSDEEEDTPTPNNGSEAYFTQYVSSRRPVTEEEKKEALISASRELDSESFMLVMRPSHVYKRFYVLMPSFWSMNHLGPEKQDLILRIEKNCWRTRFSYNKVRRAGALTCGWKYFAVDNNLEEFDVCLFKPGAQIANTYVLDVQIFRAVHEITPLTGVASAKSKTKSNKRKLVKEN
ncbi:hypothetical protein FNV43_RR11418 [Rhamnella rubrinervis]|uniref:TF-B3 domain-containing protein n=1 Tax=Rhamnella rubrinervis TaxID=2594499 RepID=A0A8K0MH88_9ROSA|nr:hypothetical protein FNV43_RR11418 [Rhamnella rubrinervis]